MEGSWACDSGCWTSVPTPSTCSSSTPIVAPSRTPQHSEKSELRLAEHIDRDGDLGRAGADALVAATIQARIEADRLDCDELLAFATSAVRDAGNSAKVLERVAKEAGVDLNVLSGEDEARLTFLAVRRWFGWSAGNLICLDIGGGSLELGGRRRTRTPNLAFSLPLGAARLTRDWFSGDPPAKAEVAELRELRRRAAGRAGPRGCSAAGQPDRVVATSKTFRTLARLAGAAPSSAGARAPPDPHPHRADPGALRSSRAWRPGPRRARRGQRGPGPPDAGRCGRRRRGDGRARRRPSSSCARGRCARE